MSTSSQAIQTVDVRFCHTCGFRYKAHWLASTLRDLLPSTAKVTLTPVSAPVGSFMVSCDGKTVYEKSRQFHGSAPQPTPEEIDTLVQRLAPRSLTPAELADYRLIHRGQMKAGMSPPWAIKMFDPRTGAPVNGVDFSEWQQQLGDRTNTSQITTATGGGKQSMQTLIAENAVVLVGAFGCGYCARAKSMLTASGIDFKFYELTGGRLGGKRTAERKELDSLTGFGPRTVPYFWVNGKYAGGCNDGPEPWMGVRKLIQSGQLKKMLVSK